MRLFHLDYGDLIRPPFRVLRSRGWGQCTNVTSEYLVVYGPKHPEERSIFDTSPYVLPPGSTTPDDWDCDGFLLPANRMLRWWHLHRSGPLAVKFWNHRHFRIARTGLKEYRCSWPNGLFQPSQINWAIPNFSYEDIVARLGLPG